jgi:murein DD-endopeptidase MepM/ murein hydrolase activator NlpD
VRSPHFARTARLRRAGGLLAPLAVATALAVAGHQLPSPASVPAHAVTAFAAERPERTVAGPAPALSVAPRTAAAAVRRTPVRASRGTRRVAPKVVRARGWVRPAGGPVTSDFGMRWGKLHKGLDFGAPYGSPIYAAADGVVIYAGPEGGYGRLLLIRHAGGIVTAYGHMSRFNVRTGQRVTAGQVVAFVGSAGHSTGPHLHFEVRPGGGAAINPAPFLRARGVRL